MGSIWIGAFIGFVVTVALSILHVGFWLSYLAGGFLAGSWLEEWEEGPLQAFGGIILAILESIGLIVVGTLTGGFVGGLNGLLNGVIVGIVLLVLAIGGAIVSAIGGLFGGLLARQETWDIFL